MTGDADGPGQAANCEPLAERRAEAVTSIRQHATEADTGRDYAIDLRQGDLWFCPFSSTFDRNAGSLQPHPIAGPTLGEEKAQGQHHWNFAAGECQDTSVWQLAFLPRAEAYCGATPTECLPFFGNAVSSITNTASLLPTSRSA